MERRTRTCTRAGVGRSRGKGGGEYGGRDMGGGRGLIVLVRVSRSLIKRNAYTLQNRERERRQQSFMP